VSEEGTRATQATPTRNLQGNVGSGFDGDVKQGVLGRPMSGDYPRPN